MKRTRREYLASTLVVGCAALVSFIAAGILHLTGHDASVMTGIGLAALICCSIGLVLAWRAPQR